MKLHVLTAVTRPENLAVVKESIEVAADRAKGVHIQWHLRHDPDREHVGGQHLKNEMLEDIDDGWVCILDDDTRMHPRFLQKVEMVVATAPLAKPELCAIVVSQQRVDGTVLQARPGNAVVGGIDAGQAVLRRGFVGDSRIPLTYAGDGIWLETLLRDQPCVHYMKDVLSLHNAISGVDVGPPQEVEA